MWDFNAEADEAPLRAIRGDVEDNENPQLAGRVLVPASTAGLSRPVLTLPSRQGRDDRPRHGVALAFGLLSPHRDPSRLATDVKFPESDHAPVIAEFAFLDYLPYQDGHAICLS